MIKAIIFDWGNTIMRDYPELPGPMATWDHVEWIPDAEEVLKILNQKYICCIASNAGHSDTELMIKALERINAAHYFHYFFTSKELGFKKPDISFFKSICMKIVCLPAECMMVGDNYDNDIIGAKNAGLTSVFFNERKIHGDFPDADHIIFSMKELVRLL